MLRHLPLFLALAHASGSAPAEPEKREPAPPPRVLVELEPDPERHLRRILPAMPVMLLPADGWVIRHEEGITKHTAISSGWMIYVARNGWIVGAIDLRTRSWWCAWWDSDVWSQYGDTDGDADEAVGKLAGLLVSLVKVQ